MEGAGADALATAGSEMGKAAEIFSVYMRQQDETAVNDAYTQKFSPAFRDVYTKYRASQGRDAVEQLAPAIEKMQEIRTVVRESLPNANQKKMFDNLATRRVEMELDIAAQHANTQNKVWQIGVQKSSIQNALTAVVDAADNQFAFDDALTLGREQIFRYAAANGGIGVDGLTPQESFKHFVSDALVTKISTLVITNPLRAQEELNQAGVLQQIDPKHRAVLMNKVNEHAGVVLAKADTAAIISGVRVEQAATQVAAPATTTAPAVISPASFDTAVGSLLKREGGYVAKDGNSNAPANFGINQKFNPDVDVKSLTRDKAVAIYKERYWNAIGGDTLAPATALVALDAAALQGPAVAKKLIADTNGDPLAMIEIRRQQLTALAKRDPTQARYLSGWLNRLDGLKAEVSRMPAGGLSPVSTAVMRDMAPDTSGLPNSHDIRAQLPVVLAKIDAKAEERFGPDDANPAKIAYKTRAYVAANSQISREVASLDAIQKQADDTIVAAVAGQKDQPPITDMGQILSNPELAVQYDRLLPRTKVGIQHLVAQQAQAALGKPAQVNAKLEQSIFQRMLLPSDDAQAITRPDQITPFAAQGLTMDSDSRLRAKLDALKTPEGKAFGSRVEKVVSGAASMIRGGVVGKMLFEFQRDKYEQAVLDFRLDLDAKIEEYRKAGKDPYALITPGKPEYVGTVENISTFMKTPAQALREAAIKADPASARVAVGQIGGASSVPAGEADEAAQARQAIATGASRAAVAARYKARTGKDLP